MHIYSIERGIGVHPSFLIKFNPFCTFANYLFNHTHLCGPDFGLFQWWVGHKVPLSWHPHRQWLANVPSKNLDGQQIPEREAKALAEWHSWSAVVGCLRSFGGNSGHYTNLSETQLSENVS